MRLILIAALLPVAAIASEPAAPPAMAANGAAEKLIAADTDGDGSWSKAEWTAAGRRERGFKMFDTDRNGLLTRAELRDGLTRLRERRAK